MRPQPAEPQSLWAQLSQARHVVSLLIFYCLLNYVLRLGLSPSLPPGEAQQMLLGQSLQWSYQAGHPPLATWLSWAVLTASNQSHAAFFMLRYVLMALGLSVYF